MAIGRESAFGVLAHLRSAEGQHTLLELVWQAQHLRTAFLGSEIDWRQDARLAIADEVTKAGHLVDHLQPDGTMHRHETTESLPYWLLQEEEKLRKTEKMRHAGDLQRKSKSAVDRSTESIAMKSMQKPVEVDTMSVLREATNQQELKFAQRHLATMQRYSEKFELPSKVLSGTPQFMLKEARMQAAWVEDRRKEKVGSKTGKVALAQSSACDDDTLDFQAQCRICDHFFSWTDLAAGDGCCIACVNSATPGSGSQSIATGIDEAASFDDHLCGDPADECGLALVSELYVECAGCGVSLGWSVLCPGDGSCPSCVGSDAGISGDLRTACAEVSDAHPEAASSDNRWQRHVLQAQQGRVVG